MFRSRLLAFVLAATACMPALAADWTMAGGAVHFSTPDGWTRIMKSSGDPEVMAFQVPDPSPTGQRSLARVVVTVTSVKSTNDFTAFVSEARERAATQPGAKIDKHRSNGHTLHYTAREDGVRQVTREHFVRLGGHAVQVACIRPQASAAGKQWTAAFDRGCDHVLSQIK